MGKEQTIVKTVIIEITTETEVVEKKVVDRLFDELGEVEAESTNWFPEKYKVKIYLEGKSVSGIKGGEREMSEVKWKDEKWLRENITILKKRKQISATLPVKSMRRFTDEGEHAKGIFEVEDFMFNKAIELLENEGRKVDKDSLISGLIYTQQYTVAEPELVGEFLVHLNTEIREQLEIGEEEKKEGVSTELPEGVTLVKFEMMREEDAKIVEDIFEVQIARGAEFRSAVNINNKVRTVMYEKGTRVGTPLIMICKDNDNAWSLQQTIDWAYKKIINVVAVRREDSMVEVAYVKKGIPAPPPKEKLIYTFKKTNGWTLVGEVKKR